MRDRRRTVEAPHDVEQLPGLRRYVGGQRPLFGGSSPIEGHVFTSDSIGYINIWVADEQI
jgi:hypothetical protein